MPGRAEPATSSPAPKLPRKTWSPNLAASAINPAIKFEPSPLLNPDERTKFEKRMERLAKSIPWCQEVKKTKEDRKQDDIEEFKQKKIKSLPEPPKDTDPKSSTTDTKVKAKELSYEEVQNIILSLSLPLQKMVHLICQAAGLQATMDQFNTLEPIPGTVGHKLSITEDFFKDFKDYMQKEQSTEKSSERSLETIAERYKESQETPMKLKVAFYHKLKELISVQVQLRNIRNWTLDAKQKEQLFEVLDEDNKLDEIPLLRKCNEYERQKLNALNDKEKKLCDDFKQTAKVFESLQKKKKRSLFCCAATPS